MKRFKSSPQRVGSSSKCCLPTNTTTPHLPGAINIPLKTLDRETTQQLDRARPVIVYCYDTQ
ncbi:MAG: rhodanese-like domain-containing protein [Gaiellaceae bacterium]